MKSLEKVQAITTKLSSSFKDLSNEVRLKRCGLSIGEKKKRSIGDLIKASNVIRRLLERKHHRRRGRG